MEKSANDGDSGAQSGSLQDPRRRRPGRGLQDASGEAGQAVPGPMVVSVGDVSFEDIYRRHHPRLVRLLTPRWDIKTAEDLAHDALSQLLVCLRKGLMDLSGSPWPWLRTTAINLSINLAARRRREVLTDPASMGSHPGDVGSSDTGLSAGVSRVLRMLPTRQRQAVVLHYLHGRKIEEAAQIMGVSSRGFIQLLYRARRYLKVWIARATDGARALVFLPARWLKRLRNEVEEKAARVSVRSGHPEQAVSATAQQLVTGMAAVILALGSPPVTLASEDPPDHLEPEPPALVQSEPRDPATPPGGQSPDGWGGSPSTPSSGDQPSQASAPKGGPKRLADDLTKPNENVSEPEDARFTSIVPSPRFSEDGTLLAAGTTQCWGSACPGVLFRSDDGGASWRRLEGRDFQGVSLLLPPAFGAGDDRIFAMGRTGLQVSRDGGESFEPAAVGGTATAAGSAAISPAFNSGDPTILIGAQSLMRYRDDLRTIEPVPWNTGPGPFEPTYSPGYPGDPRVFLGAVRFDEGLRRPAASVGICSDGVCSWSAVSLDPQPPRMRIGPEHSQERPLHAYTSRAAFVSMDSGTRFEELPRPWGNEVRLWDLAVQDEDSRILAAIRGVEESPKSAAGLYVSEDGGQDWLVVEDPLLAGGAEVVIGHAQTILVGLAGGGIACSGDSGLTWGRRCVPKR